MRAGDFTKETGDSCQVLPVPSLGSALTRRVFFLFFFFSLGSALTRPKHCVASPCDASQQAVYVQQLPPAPWFCDCRELWAWCSTTGAGRLGGATDSQRRLCQAGPACGHCVMGRLVRWFRPRCQETCSAARCSPFLSVTAAKLDPILACCTAHTHACRCWRRVDPSCPLCTAAGAYTDVRMLRQWIDDGIQVVMLPVGLPASHQLDCSVRKSAFLCSAHVTDNHGLTPCVTHRPPASAAVLLQRLLADPAAKQT